MKKILIAGIVFILIGGVFCGAAYAVGERYVDSTLTDTSASFSAESVSKIDIGDHTAQVNFIRSRENTDNIVVKAENIVESGFKCSLVNNTVLKISYNPTAVKFGILSFPSNIFNLNNEHAVINVYIPEGHFFDEVYFDGGVGEVDIENITVKRFTISGGVGKYDVRGLTVTEGGKLNVNCGVGDVDISGSIFGDTEIKGGVGNVRISGQINGNIKLNAGVGNMDLDLKGYVDAYNIKAKTGLGNINLNGDEIHDSARADGIYNSIGGIYNINIDGGVGNINININ